MFAPTPAWLNPRWSIAQAWLLPVRLRHRSWQSMPFTSPRLLSLALFRRRALKLLKPTSASTQGATRNYHALVSERFAHVPPEDTFPRTAHMYRLCVVACTPSTSACNHDPWQDFLHMSRLLILKKGKSRHNTILAASTCTSMKIRRTFSTTMHTLRR